MAPRLQTSTPKLKPVSRLAAPRMSSGALYAGVPRPRPSVRGIDGWGKRAELKSHNLTSRSVVSWGHGHSQSRALCLDTPTMLTRMFSGLRSAWTQPFAWSQATVSESWTAHFFHWNQSTRRGFFLAKELRLYGSNSSKINKRGGSV